MYSANFWAVSVNFALMVTSGRFSDLRNALVFSTIHLVTASRSGFFSSGARGGAVSMTSTLSCWADWASAPAGARSERAIRKGIGERCMTGLRDGHPSSAATGVPGREADRSEPERQWNAEDADGR